MRTHTNADIYLVSNKKKRKQTNKLVENKALVTEINLCIYGNRNATLFLSFFLSFHLPSKIHPTIISNNNNNNYSNSKNSCCIGKLTVWCCFYMYYCWLFPNNVKINHKMTIIIISLCKLSLCAKICFKWIA